MKTHTFVMLCLYLDDRIVINGVDFQVEAEAKQTCEHSTHHHPKTQVIPQRQALSKYPTANTIHESVEHTNPHPDTKAE